MVLTSRAVSQNLGELVIKQIPKDMMALEVWNSMCLPRGQKDAPLLLLPEVYTLLDPENSSKKMVELLQARISSEFTAALEHINLYDCWRGDSLEGKHVSCMQHKAHPLRATCFHM